MPLTKKTRVVRQEDNNIKSSGCVDGIKSLEKYMEDLKDGRPVENLSPSNDPWFLIPENIAIMITGMKELERGEFREIDIDSLFD